MKKIISMLSAFAIMIFFSAYNNAEPLRIIKPLKNVECNSAFLTSEVILTVKCLSNPTQPLGGTFRHQVKLMNGASPVANADVKINDPIGRICTFVTTNSNGEAIWNRSIPSDTKQQFYTIEFFYGNVKHYSNVAVSIPTDATNLTSYSINLNTTSSLDNRNLVMASRGGFTSTLQDFKTTLKESVDFGVAVIKDYISNPANIAITTVALVSCTAGNAIPVAGQTACAVSAKMVATNFSISFAKTAFKKMMDATDLSVADKTLLINMFDLSTIAYSVTKLDPAVGLSSLEALGSGFDFLKNANSQLIYKDGVLKGASISAQKAGSSEVYLMCVYNRDEAPGQNTNIHTTTIHPSKDPNCKENNTGDYCFQNNTNLDLKVILKSSAAKGMTYTTLFTCTLQPGQKQCFFTVPAGAARYVVSTDDLDNVTKHYYAEGSLYVDPCQENTFFINLETPSIASNIPAQTNENKNQISKDANCKENNTGDYCFQNNTNLDLKVILKSSAAKGMTYTTLFTCTIQPGQRQCFFTVPAGAARYVVSNDDLSNVTKRYYAEGSLYIDPCKENTFVIK
jgi:hypothetical protein